LSSLISLLCKLADVEGPLSPSLIEQKPATGEYVAKELFAVSRKNTSDLRISDLLPSVSYLVSMTKRSPWWSM
jgi:hypothetical protein